MIIIITTTNIAYPPWPGIKIMINKLTNCVGFHVWIYVHGNIAIKKIDLSSKPSIIKRLGQAFVTYRQRHIMHVCFDK